MSDNQLQDIVRLRAQSDTYPDFRRAPAHGVSQNAVKSEACEQEGKQTEEARQFGDDAFPEKIFINTLFEGFDFSQVDVAVNRLRLAA